MTISITGNLKMEYTRARPEGLHSEISSDDELVQAQSSVVHVDVFICGTFLGLKRLVDQVICPQLQP